MNVVFVWREGDDKFYSSSYENWIGPMPRVGERVNISCTTNTRGRKSRVGVFTVVLVEYEQILAQEIRVLIYGGPDASAREFLGLPQIKSEVEPLPKKTRSPLKKSKRVTKRTTKR